MLVGIAICVESFLDILFFLPLRVILTLPFNLLQSVQGMFVGKNKQNNSSGVLSSVISDYYSIFLAVIVISILNTVSISLYISIYIDTHLCLCVLHRM